MIVRLRNAASRWWPIGAALVVVAVAAGVAVANVRDERLRASPGDVVQDYLSSSQLTPDTIRLPYGVVTVGVTDAGADTDGSSAFDGREPPEDGSWVGVKVDAIPSDPLPDPPDSSQRTRTPKVVVELVAAGRSYVVPADFATPDSTYYPAERAAWVAVAGRPKDLRIAITYDGVRQSVRPSDGERTAGRAAPLYDLQTVTARSSSERPPACGNPHYPASFGPVDKNYFVQCTLVAYPALPYLPQLGWAPSGYRWLSFGVNSDRYPTFRYRAGTVAVDYAIVASPALRVSLDGVAATAGGTAAPTLLPNASQVNPGGLAVFRVPATARPHRLAVTATWTDVDTADGPPPPGAPVAPDLTVSWTKDIR